jgi:two-component sensor histidine kinase
MHGRGSETSLRTSDITGRLQSLCRHGLKPGSAGAFLFGAACTGFALLTQAVLGVDPPFGVFGPHYAAVLVATVVAGWSAGALASLLGLTAVLWFFVPSRFLLHLLSWREIGDIGMYLVISAIVVAITERYRILVRQLREEEHYRRLIMDELRHRLTNKAATLEAIIRRELRADSCVLEKISGRLRAVAATDELIANSNERGASIDDVLKAELEPYDFSRVLLRGPPTRLPPRPAVTLALVLHELATNAAKYGSLSVPQGRLAVSWQASGRVLTVDWMESGGPPVKPPSRQGFGGKLFQSALAPYHGGVHCEFEQTGLKCHISLTRPGDDS